MSRFYGEVIGQARTTASRCGSLLSGMWGHVRGWDVGISATAHADGTSDYVEARVTRGSNNPSSAGSPTLRARHAPGSGVLVEVLTPSGEVIYEVTLV